MGMLNNQEIYKKHMEYLEKAGVNSQVLEYLKDKYFLIAGKLNEILGDIFPGNDNKYIEILKKGSDTFRITENGGIWIVTDKNKEEFKRTEHVVKTNGEKHTFYHGALISDETIEGAVYYNYIEEDNINIIHRQVVIERRKNNDDIYYSGKIKKEIFGPDNKLKERYTSGWANESTANIHCGELPTTQEVYDNSFGLPNRSFLQIDYSVASKWQFVMRGREVGEILQDEIEDATIKFRLTLGGVKRFFSNILDRFKFQSRME